MKDSEVTREALRRLPKDVYQERQYRLTRAIGYNTGKSVLPESQWTKPEEVINELLESIFLDLNFLIML